MKKLIINSLICSVIFATPAIASNESMFENTNSKEWSSTPSNVKSALKNIKVMSGSSAQDMMSTNWLNEFKRSPSTYGLNDADVAWVDGMLNNSKGKKQWNPKTRVVIDNNKNNKNNKEKIESIKTSSNNIVDKKQKVVIEKTNESKPLQDKKVVKAISTPLPKPPENFALTKKPDLTPEREQDKKENNMAKIIPYKKTNEVKKVKNENLIKTSDALIAIYKKDVKKEREDYLLKNKQLISIIDEILRVENINRENILNDHDKIIKLNEIYRLIEKENNYKLNSQDIASLIQIVNLTQENVLEIMDKLNVDEALNVLEEGAELFLNEEDLLIKESESMNTNLLTETTSNKEINIVKNPITNDIKEKENILIKEEKIENNDTSISMNKTDKTNKTKNIFDFLSILIGFGIINLFILKLIGFRKNK